MTGLPVTELDQVFWSADLEPTPQDRWEDTQRQLVAKDAWVLEGDLGTNDSLQPRLAEADTVIIVDFGLLRCAWRVLHRGRERADFWRWVIVWRRHSRPHVLAAVARWAPGADVHV
ncbi:MAG: adenylate kinase, partial [Acidimicrobiales bacterium]